MSVLVDALFIISSGLQQLQALCFQMTILRGRKTPEGREIYHLVLERVRTESLEAQRTFLSVSLAKSASQDPNQII